MPLTNNAIDHYISNFPKEVRLQLHELRTIIKKAAPDAEEVIGYAMPTYKLFGNLVHFAGYKNHIGFYPAPSGIIHFEKELALYKTSKGAIQLPIGEPLPKSLIEEIVRYRIAENKAKQEAKKSKKTCSKGHSYFKSSDCPTCPICEKNKKPQEGLFNLLGAPARRALEGIGISTVPQLAKYTEKEIASLHGLGPSTIKILKQELLQHKLSFKK